MPVLNPSLAARVPNGVMHELQRFYYDTAWTANGYVLPSLLHLVPKEQVLFGSDYPHPEGTNDPIGRFERSMGALSDDARTLFYSKNFEQMLGLTEPAIA